MDNPGVGAGLLALLFIIGCIFLIILFIGGCSSFERTSGGEVAIVRNGGPFDNNKIRQYIPEASDRTWTGLWSSTHKYPSSQRFYKISSNAEESDTGLVDQVRVPTSNGVNVGVEGTIYFELNTEETILKQFDDEYGVRTFSGHHPYDGNDGFAAWLNTILRPVIDNNLRKQIGSVTCADLIPSCALVQNQGNLDAVDKNQGVNSNEKLAEIEEAINEGLAADIKSQLGEDYLTGIRFTLAKVVPPDQIQAAIDKAQSAFAGVTTAEAQRRKALIDAETNKAKQEGYEACPACAAVAVNKSIPKGITTWAPGRSFAVTP